MKKSKKPLIFLAIFLFTCQPAISQEFDFQRLIDPFLWLDENGDPYDLPLTGGMNRPVHQFVDIDGDNDPDLFVQDRANLLTYFRNVGTGSNYQFEWLTDNFSDLAIGSWFKFADVDQDGDFDLLAENPVGLIRYYRNDGTALSPNFVLAMDVLKDVQGNNIIVDGFSIPEWADIDCDNEMEFFLGRLNGQITLYEFTGLNANNVPQYQLVTDIWENLVILTGGRASLPQPNQNLFSNGNLHGANSMTFVDINNDQDNDLFWGDFFASSIIFLENSGNCTTPQMAITLEFYPPVNSVSTGGYNVPRFTDIDNDGDQDMFVGVLGGFASLIVDRVANFYFYENTGSVSQPDFILRTQKFINSIDLGQNTIPSLTDIDDDGDLDLFLANQEDVLAPNKANSRLYFFENLGTAASPSFRLVNTDYLNFDKENDVNYAPTFADIDDDGDQDLFLGNWWGTIIFYRNDGSTTSPNFVRVTDNFQGIDVGANSTPAFVDIDADGDLDLFSGEFTGLLEFGRINFYRNTGSSSSPNFELVTKNYFDIDIGSSEFLYTHFADIDDDGDQDLLLGSTNQGIILYRNTGTPQLANFVLASNFTLPLHIQTNPNLADIDADGDLDLFSGANGGGLIFYENRRIFVPLTPKDPQPRTSATINLLNNFPNPFNPQTTIEYQMTLPPQQLGGVHFLTIYNLLGQVIKKWQFANTHSQLTKTVIWDGNNQQGIKVPSGIYFYEVRLDAATGLSRKMLLTR